MCILLKYFPKSYKLKNMKVKNVKIKSKWNRMTRTGSMILTYTYVGLDVKFFGSILYENGKFTNYYELYSKFNCNEDYSEIHVETFENEDIKSFEVIKELFRNYDLKTIIYKTFYNYRFKF